MQIVPAILEKNPDDLFAQIHKLSSYFNRFQIDIQDGLFVSNKTLSLNVFLDYLIQHRELRTDLSQLIFDFHLMVKDYEKEIVKIQQLKKCLNIKAVFLHVSLVPKIYDLRSKISDVAFGLVLNPEDGIETLTAHYSLQTVPCIQIMTIHPGPQGQSFIPETLQKIEQLKKLGYHGEILLDGGINDQTIPFIMSKTYKPDALCIGSYLTKTEHLKAAITSIRRHF